MAIGKGRSHFPNTSTSQYSFSLGEFLISLIMVVWGWRVGRMSNVPLKVMHGFVEPFYLKPHQEVYSYGCYTFQLTFQALELDGARLFFATGCISQFRDGLFLDIQYREPHVDYCFRELQSGTL